MNFLIVFLLSTFFIVLTGCSDEAKHLDKPQYKSDVKKSQSANTAICGADWEGDRGDLIFPGLVTLDECEALCEPIYEELIENNGTGYCQFGQDRIWELPYYNE